MPEIDLPGGPEFPYVVHVGDVPVTWHRLAFERGWFYLAMIDDRVWIVNDSQDVRDGYEGDLRLALNAWSPTAVEYWKFASHLAEQIRLTMDLEDRL